MRKILRKIFGWNEAFPISFYLCDFLFRKILRQNADIKWPVHFTSTFRSGHLLKAGKHTFPGDSPYNYFDASNGIEIGDYTNFGPNVTVVSSNHDLYDNDIIVPERPVKIGAFCWLGAQAVILPGVELGDFTIVGAGAVVTKSFEEGYCVIAGNPAKVIKYLDKEKCKHIETKKSR
jgi:acetyltransferase-like isoleucine patch superfamily enzyme